MAVLAFVAGGCSSDVSQNDFSGQFSRTICAKAYECLEASQLETYASVYGRNRDECPATYASVSPLGCAAGQTLDRGDVDKCLGDLRALTCSLVKSNGAVVAPYSCTVLCPAINDSDAGGVDARVVRRDGSSEDAAEPADDAASGVDASPADAGATVDAPDAPDAPDADVVDAPID